MRKICQVELEKEIVPAPQYSITSCSSNEKKERRKKSQSKKGSLHFVLLLGVIVPK
jgi:hypothetical protein